MLPARYHPFLLFGLSSLALLATAFPTVDWWSSANYAACAYTLGIPPQAGSILFVLLGRVFSVLLWFAEPVRAITMVSVCAVSLAAVAVHAALRELLKGLWAADGDSPAARAASFATALALPFVFSVWRLAGAPNEYTLGLLLTACILWCAVRLWFGRDRAADSRALLLLAYLLGLDTVAHRLNTPLLPVLAVVLLVAWRRHRFPWQFALALAGCFVLGVTPHLYLPIRGHLLPPVNVDNTTTLAATVEWIRMRRTGEPNNLAILFARRAPFWSYQMWQMCLRYFAWGLAGHHGPATPAAVRVLAAIPALLACVGFAVCMVKRTRTWALLTAALLSNSVLLAVYLNIWNDFFRGIDRLFLPGFPLALLWTGVGLHWVLDRVLRPAVCRRRWVTALAGLVAVAVVPLNLALANLYECNRSRYLLVTDYGRDVLSTCEPNAILLTTGDNDTYPLWYLQEVEGYRTDVTVANMWLLNMPWYRRQLARRAPGLATTMTQEQMDALRPGPNPSASPATVSLAKAGLELQLPGSDVWPWVRVHDRVILSIVDANAGERPIYCTQAPTAGGLPGLHPYFRCAGAAWQFQRDTAGSETGALIARETVRRNLLEVYRYRGFNDSALWLEAGGAAGDPGVGMFFRVREGFLLLARHYLDSGEPARARQVLDAMDERLPSWRFPSERNPAVRRLRRELGDAGVLPAGPDSSVAPGR